MGDIPSVVEAEYIYDRYFSKINPNQQNHATLDDIQKVPSFYDDFIDEENKKIIESFAYDIKATNAAFKNGP